MSHMELKSINHRDIEYCFVTIQKHYSWELKIFM